MTTTTAPGTFCWNEVASPNLDASKEFYCQLFGWTAEENPMPGDGPGVYVLFKLNGVDIAGGYQLSEEVFPGVPPHWAAYVSVKNVDATLAKALAAGGTPTMPAMDIPEIGRMAGFMDPTGAAIAIFQMGDKEERPSLGTATGFPCWNELATNDTAKAGAFYHEVFDWGVDKKDGGPMPYTEWTMGDQSVGGMLQIDPAWGPVPPYWAMYVSVENCDVSLARALELGAKIKAPAMDVEGVGRFACLADPTGVVFSIITLDEAHC